MAASPEGGRANDAVVELLAERLALPRRSVSVVSGHHGRDKVVLLEGVEADEADRRLSGAEGKQ